MFVSSLDNGFVSLSLVRRVICFNKFIMCEHFERYNIVEHTETLNQIKFVSRLCECF